MTKRKNTITIKDSDGIPRKVPFKDAPAFLRKHGYPSATINFFQRSVALAARDNGIDLSEGLAMATKRKASKLAKDLAPGDVVHEGEIQSVHIDRVGTVHWVTADGKKWAGPKDFRIKLKASSEGLALAAKIPKLAKHEGSWVVTSPSGKTIELFERKNVKKAIDAGYTVETIGDYLARVNRKIKDDQGLDGFDDMLKSKGLWLALGLGVVGWFVLKPSSVKARTAEELLAEGGEDPTQLVTGLDAYLRSGGNFGSKTNPSERVAAVQRALQVADDGVMGPDTRAAARKYGVELPIRPGAPRTDAPASEWQVTMGTAVLTPAASAAGAVEPEPARVVNTPKSLKGSLVVVASVELSGLMSLASQSQVEGEIKKNSSQLGRFLNGCPGAPQLVGSPSISAKGSGGGKWSVEIRWAATWSTDGMPAGLKQCIAKNALAMPQLKNILTGLNITRS